MNRSTSRQPAWAITFLLLAGAALRLVGLNNISPPGITHDEVANWLIDRSILAGEHAIYFTRAYGHEAGFHYLQTGFVTLLGDNVLALRLPAAFCGLLGIAVTFALARKLFGKNVALMAAGLLAVLFWPVFYGRLALRAISSALDCWIVCLLLVASLGSQSNQPITHCICLVRYFCRSKSAHLHGRPRRANFLRTVAGLFGIVSLATISGSGGAALCCL